MSSVLWRAELHGLIGENLDDPELFHGMPIGLQVICQRLEEEKVLAIAEEVERILEVTAK